MRYSFGNCILDTECYELLRAGQPVPLRPKVFQVLTYLLAHRNRVVSKDELLEQCWPNQFIGDAPLHACITAVRKAIGDHGIRPPLLGTMRSRGYRFLAPVHEQNAATAEPPPPPASFQEEAPGLRSGLYSAIAERKPVTVLYCALATASAPPACLELEAMYHAMQTMGEHAQDVVRHYEGTMIHVTGAGITLLFGAPVAHEDHARRAVLAALELRHRLHLSLGKQALLLTASMGLHTGLVIVGRLSQSRSWMYTGVGDTTHLAIQLQQRAASGGILLSAATYRLVREEIQGAAPVPIEVDGTRTPAYAIQGCIQQCDGVPVGRERELALLHDRLVLATQRRGQAVRIAGTPLPSTLQESQLRVAQQLVRAPRDSADPQPVGCLDHEAVYEAVWESDKPVPGATALATQDCTRCVCQEF